MKKFSLVIVLFIFFGYCQKLFADRIFLKSGEIVLGEIVASTNDYVKIKTEHGLLMFPSNDVNKIENNEDADKSPSSRMFHNEKYGVTITGPQSWYMQTFDSLSTTRKETIIDNVGEKIKNRTGSDSEVASGRKLTKELLENIETLVLFRRNSVVTEANAAKNPQVIITIVNIDDLPQIKDAMDYVKKICDAKEQHKSGNCRIVESPQEIELNGAKGAFYSEEFTSARGTFRSLEYYFLLHDRKICLLVALANVQEFDQVLPVFQEAINSFHVK